MIIAKYIAVVVIGYLLGSIPFGLLISRRSNGVDLRKVGSGNIGMTNVLRASGKKAAALSLILDMAKGALAVIVAGLIFGNDYHQIAQVIAALAAIAGHSRSIFLGFKGGRGVATFIGGLLAMYWPAAVIGGGIMLIIGFTTKYMSLGSIIGAVAAFLTLLVSYFLKSYAMEQMLYTIYAMLCSIFIFITHRHNIMRLVSGTELRLDQKARANNPPLPGDIYNESGQTSKENT